MNQLFMSFEVPPSKIGSTIETGQKARSCPSIELAGKVCSFWSMPSPWANPAFCLPSSLTAATWRDTSHSFSGPRISGSESCTITRPTGRHGSGLA